MASDEAPDSCGHHIGNAAASRIDVIRMTCEDGNPTEPDSSSSRRLVVSDLYENDVDAVFCRHVLSELRRLPPFKRDLAKIVIERILFQVKHRSEQRAE